MSAKNDGGTAFPAETNEHSGAFGVPSRIVSSGGMSLRDYFAARAMQPLIAGGQFGSIEYLAEKAYIYADAMISEREK